MGIIVRYRGPPHLAHSTYPGTVLKSMCMCACVWCANTLRAQQRWMNAAATKCKKKTVTCKRNFLSQRSFVAFHRLWSFELCAFAHAHSRSRAAHSNTNTHISSIFFLLFRNWKVPLCCPISLARCSNRLGIQSLPRYSPNTLPGRSNLVSAEFNVRQVRRNQWLCAPRTHR